MIRRIRAELAALRDLRLTERGEAVLLAVTTIVGVVTFFVGASVYIEIARLLTGQ